MATAVADECTAEGPGLTGKWKAQQVRTEFTITACARGGAPLLNGGETFKVKARGPGPVEPNIKDKRDGTYLVELTYPISGKYEVLVSLGYTPIKGSPFQVVVQAARRPPAPAPPRFGGAADRTSPQLEWDPPEHTGGMPLTGYTVYAAREGLGGPWTIAPETTSWPLPAMEGTSASASAWYYGFQISASNDKGEGEKSVPGPRPTPFDSARLDAERAALLKTFDKQALPSGEPGGEQGMVVETYLGRASGSAELAMAAASYPSGLSLVKESLARLRRAGAAWDEAGGAPGGATAVRADVDGATAHEVAVALLLHVWDVLMPGGAPLSGASTPGPAGGRSP